MLRSIFFTCIFNSLIFGILLFLCVNAKIKNEVENNDNENQLPECTYINPAEEMKQWDEFDFSKCKIINFKSLDNESKNKEIYDFGEKHYSYNSYVSDMIGSRRNLSYISAHERCASVKRDVGTLRANIIIIYHNEAFSVLVRMINSIIAETNPNLLHKIILYDDFSDEKVRVENLIQEYIKLQNKKADRKIKTSMAFAWGTKLQIYHSNKREGLIRAKVLASRLIHDNDDDENNNKNNVLIFLDSHCEVTKGWIEPLLSPIQENIYNVVLPVVDLIDPFKFEYSKAMVARGSFNWGLKFEWEYFDWSYFDEPDNNVKPFNTTAPSGGLLAISEQFFRKIGEYDMGMEIWGAENIELAVRVWLCGGSILTAPCSRVGHVFRNRRPYSGKPGVDTSLYNSLRTVNVWFDEYKDRFFEFRPDAKHLETGDLIDRLKLKKSLNCKPFSWFIENIHTTLYDLRIAKKKQNAVKSKQQKTQVRNEL